MSHKTLSIHGLSFSKLTLEQAVREALSLAQNEQGGIAPFVNVHVLMESVDNAQYQALLQKSRMIFADGMPIVWLSRLLADPLPERVSGPDFMRAALIGQTQSGAVLRVACVGSTPEVLEKLKAKYPGVLMDSPPFRKEVNSDSVREDWNRVLALAGGEPPAWVFVGLGAPKQERWMAYASELSPKTLFFGVGAAFDFLAGTKKRAPQWMRRLGLEWLYRLASEPKRLFKRYFLTNSKFLVRSGLLFLKRENHGLPKT